MDVTHGSGNVLFYPVKLMLLLLGVNVEHFRFHAVEIAPFASKLCYKQNRHNHGIAQSLFKCIGYLYSLCFFHYCRAKSHKIA